MDGNDAATTWMSKIAMNIPMHIRLKPNQVATRACVVLQTVVVPADADFSIWRKLRVGVGPRRNNRAGGRCTPLPPSIVMAGLVPAIYVFTLAPKTWMPG